MSEGRGSERFAFGVAECQDGVTGHKTERGAFSTNTWSNLGGDVWRPGVTTADDKYDFHRESTLSEVCSGHDNDYEIDLGLKSLGETKVRGAMTLLEVHYKSCPLPEMTGDTNPPKITFTASDFYDFFSCYKCSEDFDDKEMFETHMKDRHSQNYYCRHCQVEFSGNAGLTDHINTTHVTWSTTTWEAPDDDLS